MAYRMYRPKGPSIASWSSVFYATSRLFNGSLQAVASRTMHSQRHQCEVRAAWRAEGHLRNVISIIDLFWGELGYLCLAFERWVADQDSICIELSDLIRGHLE